MLQLIDTHSHIYQEDFNADIEDVMKRAADIGISNILLPNVDMESIDQMHCLCDTYPSVCIPMMGLHPTSVHPTYDGILKEMKPLFSQRKYIAVGEIGIDLYWDKTYLKEQKEAFEEQLKWSIELDLPVVIHNRDAFSEVMDSISKVGDQQLRGVFHSFGGSQEDLETILALDNFMIGINGVLTFKKSEEFRNYLNIAPLERILLETDAPYLSPVPFRGKRNEPSYMLNTAQKLAEVYGVSLEKIGAQTTLNARQLFALDISS